MLFRSDIGVTVVSSLMLNCCVGDRRRVVQFWRPIRSVHWLQFNRDWSCVQPSRLETGGSLVLPPSTASTFVFELINRPNRLKCRPPGSPFSSV